MQTKYGNRKKRWGLKATVKPQEGSPLSGVVHILDEKGPGFCYVKFDWPLVSDVGAAMPVGIGEHAPVYLMAMRLGPERWIVYGIYVKSGRRQPLWLEEGQPQWVRSIKRKEHDSATTGEAPEAG